MFLRVIFILTIGTFWLFCGGASAQVLVESTALEGAPHAIVKTETENLAEQKTESVHEPPKEESAVSKEIPNDPMHIFFGVSDNYAKYAGVAMTSILQNTSRKCHFYILSNDLSDTSKAQFEKMKQKWNFEVDYVAVDKDRFKDFSDGIAPRVSKEGLYRLLIPEVAPDLKKAIYLDADLVVARDLALLWDTDLGDNYLAAVADPLAENIEDEIMSRLDLPKGFLYINSGVMLMNIEKLRADHMVEKFFDIAKHYATRFTFVDQDILNVACVHKIRYLDRYFNAIPTLWYAREEQRNIAFTNPVIIHWAGDIKPWQNSDVPMRDYYTKYENILTALGAWGGAMSGNDPMHIFFGVSDNYAKYAGVAMTSILQNTSRKCHFYILSNNLSDTSKAQFEKMKQKWNFEVDYVAVDKDRFKDFGESAAPYISKDGLYRLLIPEVAPDLKKAIYLDADLVVARDLALLWDTDLGDNYLAAVPDPAGRRPVLEDFILQLDLPQGALYINSGVMLMNIEKLRADHMMEKFFDIAKHYGDKLAYPDQDILNKACAPKIHYLTYNFNALPVLWYPLETDRAEAFTNPVIIHWAGHVKPWQNSDAPMRDYYTKYENILTALGAWEKTALVSQE